MIKSRRVLKSFKGLCIVYTAIFVASIFLLNFSLFSYAEGNWTDRLYEYTNTSSVVEITDAVTPYRAKEDYSSSYAYNDASNTNIDRVFVLGGYVDRTYGAYKSLPIGQAYYFPNLVKEKKENSAALKFWPAYGKQGMHLHIWWSPDSI